MNLEAEMSESWESSALCTGTVAYHIFQRSRKRDWNIFYSVYENQFNVSLFALMKQWESHAITSQGKKYQSAISPSFGKKKSSLEVCHVVSCSLLLVKSARPLPKCILLMRMEGNFQETNEGSMSILHSWHKSEQQLVEMDYRLLLWQELLHPCGIL